MQFSPPSDYSRIKVVNSFEELVATPFDRGVNALCWHRNLRGDFSEVVQLVAQGDQIATLDDAALNALPVGPAGRIAVAILLEDLQLLRSRGLAPVLDCIKNYPRDAEDAVVQTDVYSFHADRAPVQADTYLCTYVGAASEGLRNDEAQKRSEIGSTRTELRKLFGGENDLSFQEFLSENCYDLHYAPNPGAKLFSFGLGNLWRIAIDYPDSPVPPCLHRAPETRPGDLPRLLLIS